MPRIVWTLVYRIIGLLNRFAVSFGIDHNDFPYPRQSFALATIAIGLSSRFRAGPIGFGLVVAIPSSI